MKIGCVQFAPTYRDIKKNLDQISDFVHTADADLVIFPELALTGYSFTSPDEIASLAERIDGPIALALGEIAKRENKAIITGFLEEGTGLTPTPLPAGRGANTLLPAGRRGQGDEAGVQFYNAALAFDNAGKLAGHYRKVHLFYFETQIFSRGDLGFPVFPLQTRSGTAQVGMLICYDWRFPEAAHALALKGAELIAMPSNIVTTTGMLHTTLQTRAFENKVPLAFADRIGSEEHTGETLAFRGESAIIGMNGEILAKASEDRAEIIVADVDLSKTRNKRINKFNDIFSDRPEAGYGL